MALKIWLNGQMKNLTRSQMVTFVGGTKKKLKKGITFVNGEKKILWQTNEYMFNSWTLTELQYPNTITNTTLPTFYAMEANYNKIAYNVGNYICRANISNLSSPSNENTVQNGFVTYRQPDKNSTSVFDANYGMQTGTSTNVNINKIEVNQTTLSIDTTTSSSIVVNTASYSSPAFNGLKNIINTGSNYGLCMIYPVNGQYEIRTNFTGANYTVLATISGMGYSTSYKPVVWSYALFDNRYLLIGTQYQATSGGDYIYRLYRVDLTNGNTTVLLNNKTLPINAILCDGNYIIVTYENVMVKMDINGSVLATYTATNDIPTLIGRCNGYYYMTTTRTENDEPYMNIEIVNVNNFSDNIIKQTNCRMLETLVFPYESNSGYLCFASRYYKSTTYAGGGSLPPSGRQASIRINSGGVSTSTVYSDTEYRINRIQCY